MHANTIRGYFFSRNLNYTNGRENTCFLLLYGKVTIIIYHQVYASYQLIVSNLSVLGSELATLL